MFQVRVFRDVGLLKGDACMERSEKRTLSIELNAQGALG